MVDSLKILGAEQYL